MPVHGKRTRVFCDSYDLSTYFRNAEITGDAPIIDTTTFNQSAKTFIPDYIEGGASLSGVWSADPVDIPDNPNGLANRIDDVLQPILGSNTNSVWTIAPEGADSQGLNAQIISAKEIKYSITAPSNSLVAAAGEIKSDGAIRRGVVLAEAVARTTTGTGSANNGTAQSTAGFVAHLHLFAISGTNPNVTVTIEDSADGATGWATIGSFTALTAIGSQRIEVAGTVRQYVHAKWTITGTGPSATFVVAFSRL